MNYANWEITQLLPIENTISEESGSMWIVYNINDKSEKFRQTDYYEPTYDENYLVRQCYSWEDIRLYLESKGFVICYSADTKNCQAFIYRRNFDTDMFLNGEIKGTYEQAREEAIKWCLDAIKRTEN